MSKKAKIMWNISFEGMKANNCKFSMKLPLEMTHSLTLTQQQKQKQHQSTTAQNAYKYALHIHNT